MWNNGLFAAFADESSEINGTGTANTVAKFTGAQTIGNSNITDDGTTVTISSRTVIAPPVATSGTPTGLTYTGAAHTTLTASTEFNDLSINLNRTVQFATGAFATQRAINIAAPTYAFVGASTITNAATLYVDAAPVAGTNATITNGYSIWVDAGNVRFDGLLSVGTGAAPTAVATIAASSTARASINIASGTAPTTPAAGDMWYDGTTLNFRASGFSISSATNPASWTTAGTNSMFISDNTAVGTNNTCIGISTNVTGGGSYATYVGRNVTGAGVTNTAIGTDIAAGTGTGGIAIGTGVTLGNFNYSIAIGYGATTTAAMQMVVGGTSGTALSNVFFNAVSNIAANLSAVTLQTTGVTAGVADSSAALSILNIAGARGTGSAQGGDVRIQIAMPGASGTAQNSLTTVLTVRGNDSGISVAQQVNVTGSPYALLVTGAAHTTLTASAEAVDVNYNLARTVQFATGAITTQRAFLIQAPTYGFVGASTITNAATLAISGSPVAGTNATITNSYSLWVQGGNSLMQGGLTLTPAAQTGSPVRSFTINSASHTSLTASTEYISVYVNGAVTQQFATGAITLQRYMAIDAPTYGFVGASTITQAATLYINGGPTAGTNATITNSYALYITATGTQCAAFERTDDNNNSSTCAILKRARSSATAPGANFGANLAFQLEGFTNNSIVGAGNISVNWEVAQTNDTTTRDSYMILQVMQNNVAITGQRINSSGMTFFGAGSDATAFVHISASGGGAGTAPIKMTTGTLMGTAEVGALEYATPTLYFTNGPGVRQEIILSQQARVTTQFDKTADTALANITGLSVSVAASQTYRFEAILHVTADATGGSKFAIAGTATATAIIYEILMVDNTSNLNTITSRQTALAGSAGQAGTTSGFVRITGLITVNAAGTLTVQFAQNASNNTSSVLVGSSLLVEQIS